MIAHIQYRRGLPATEGCYQAWRALEERGWEIRPFAAGDQVEAVAEQPVIGGIVQVVAALRRLDVRPPDLDYPEGLRSLLVDPAFEQTTLGRVRQDPARWPLFVKPTSGHKEFPGRVIQRTADLIELVHVPDEAAVFTARAVDLRDSVEWRCFVIDGEARDVRPYTRTGDAAPPPSTFIDEVLARWPDAPRGCAVDLVDVGGAEAGWRVIECNDGFSLGTYGLRRETYAELLVKRWGELTGMPDLWVR